MQGWLAYYFQSLHHPLSLSLPVCLEWKPWLRKTVQGWPGAFWPQEPSPNSCRDQALRRDIHIP